MQKWEYLVIQASRSFVSHDVLVEAINGVNVPKHQQKKLMPFLQEMGKQGWTLVIKDGLDYFFKRPIEE